MNFLTPTRTPTPTPTISIDPTYFVYTPTNQEVGTIFGYGILLLIVLALPILLYLRSTEDQIQNG